MEGSAGSSSGSKIGVDGGKFEAADIALADLFEDWKAFFEFLKNRQPPRSPSDCTANDAVEFLRGLPSDKIEAVVRSLNVPTFKGGQMANPFQSQAVKTFLMEFAEEQTSEKEYDKKKLSHHNKETLFQICLTTKDLDNLDSFLIPNEEARKYFFPYLLIQVDTQGFFIFEDEDGKIWRFGYSYHNIGRRCEFTTGWSRYVKEKQLRAGDYVFFQRDRTHIKRRFFIGCIRGDGGGAPTNDALESSPSALLNPTSPAKSDKKLKLREKPKEVETSFQQRLPEHIITGFDPILVISCGNNEDSDETYFISCIFNELYMRGFAPCRYDLTRSTVTENPELLFRSRVCIMIITMNYARSRECLDEFMAIMGQFTLKNLALLPVFLNKIPGSFENSVLASELQKWRKALNKLSVYKKYQYMKGDEVMLAKSIVRDVCLLISPGTCRNLIGIKLLLESILQMLQCPQPSGPQILGLWGMAGIGKTTITREIFRTQAQRYDLSYFLPDFHIMCQTNGLNHWRDDFFSKILGEEKVFIDECDTKISFLRDRFLDKRVLIVLDGVSNAKEAEVLVGGFGWFSGGHTIILTSRNKQVLVQCKAKELYEIPRLSKYESLRLCCQFATERNWKGRMSLISELVNYASGIPLALRVLGSSVQKQCINNEKQHLRRLRQHPPIEIQDAFRKGFDRLDDDEKNIFLDLACFFRGENKDRVVNILDGCGFFTDLGIYGLIDESLISLVDNKIEMPNIFQDTGRFFVCQEYEEAGKRSRLWDSNDIVGVLTKNSGTEEIEGIFLDISGLSFELSPTVFERMHRLRLLKLHCPTSDNHWKVCLPQGLHSLPDELRLLHWEKYPLGSLPWNFNPKNLVELSMPYSNIKRLWKGSKNLEKLKKLILTHSRHLNKFPRLSKARNLEHIDLEGCVNLVKVNSSIIHHDKLTFLSLKGCLHLKIMPPMVHLESLEVLNLSGCSELENLQTFSPNLKEIYLAGTAIREMPSSIGDLTRLVTLDLENCEKLQHLPPGLSNLKAMVTLKLSGCSNLKSLPNLDALFLSDVHCLNTKRTKEDLVAFKLHSAIQESRLDGSEILLISDHLNLRPNIDGSCYSRDAASDRRPQESWVRVTITRLPSSISHSLASRLYSLVSLFLCNAYLVDIPEELCWLASVKTLDLGGNSFSQIPKSIKELHKLHILRLRHCKKLRSLPVLPRSLEILNAHGCVSLESFPPDFEKFPRHFTFSNCFNLSPEVVREFIRNVQYSVEGMTKGRQLEQSKAPAFSIYMPASAGHKSSVNFQAGSFVLLKLTPGTINTISGFAFSVVVEFWDNYSSAAGFGIKCTCRKSRTDFSRRREIIFRCWAPTEAPTVQKDHMFFFGCVNMITAAEEMNHDFLGDIVKFEFHPVDWENNILDESCTVKKCSVNLFTAAIDDSTLRVKRSSSSKDREDLSSMENMTPPYKKCRLKRVFETVILNIRKRKREMSVSTVKNLSKDRLGSSPWSVNVSPERPGHQECLNYMMTGECKFGNRRDRETSVPESSLSPISLPLRPVRLGPLSARLEHDQNYRHLKHNDGKELGSHKCLTIETAPSQSSSSLTDSSTSIRKPAQSAARIYQVCRTQFFEKKLKEFGDSKFGVSVSALSPKIRKREWSYSDESVFDAAIRIQANFRGHKCRKQRLFTRQGTILIQARWRGYQARKQYQHLIMSMRILK